MRAERLGLALLVLVAGCRFGSASTVVVARFGYDQPARVGLMVRGPSRSVETMWSAALGRGGQVTVVAHESLAGGPPGPVELGPRMCRRAVELAAAGAPLDRVVGVVTTESSANRTKCTKWAYRDGFLAGITSKSGDDGRYCAKDKYLATAVTFTSTIEVLDGRTCQHLGTRTLMVTELAASGDPGRDLPAARAAVEASHARAAVATAAVVFPAGVELAAVDGRRLEGRAASAPTVVPGEIFQVRGVVPGKVGSLGRVRVLARDGDRVVLEAEADGVAVGPGDQLRTVRLRHLWSLYPTVQAGAARVDGVYRGTGGASFDGRWHMRGLPLMAEVSLGVDGTGAADVTRTSLGLAAGLRWPYGRVAPLVLAEAGVLTARQPDLADVPARAGGYHLGLGAGLEVDLGPLFVLADLRWRTVGTGDWETEPTEESGDTPMPTEVRHDDDTRIVIGRLGVGWWL